MITELSISDSTLSDLDWFKSIDRILKRAKFDNYYDIHQYEDHGYILGPGSIRGFSFHISGNDLKCHIDEFASITDWQLMYTLIRDLVTEGRGLIFLDSEQYSLLNISKKDATKQYLDHMRQAIIENREQLSLTNSANLEITVNDFCIHLPAEKLTKDLEKDHELWGSLEKHLISQVEKYGPVQHAKVSVLRTADADLQVINYHHLPTVIPKEIDYISMKGITKSLEGLIPLNEFIAILKTRIKDLKLSYYIPEINFHEETELYNSLKSVQIAVPQTITDEDLDEDEEEVEDESENELWKQTVDEIIDKFIEGKTVAEITLNICSDNELSEEIKSVGQATIDTFQLIAKDNSLVQNFAKLKQLLLNKNYTDDICDTVLKNIFIRVKEIAPEGENSSINETFDDGGWFILASFITLSVLGVLFIIVKSI